MLAAAEVVFKHQVPHKVELVVQVVEEMAVGLLLRVNLDKDFHLEPQTQVVVEVAVVPMK